MRLWANPCVPPWTFRDHLSCPYWPALVRHELLDAESWRCFARISFRFALTPPHRDARLCQGAGRRCNHRRSSSLCRDSHAHWVAYRPFWRLTAPYACKAALPCDPGHHPYRHRHRRLRNCWRREYARGLSQTNPCRRQVRQMSARVPSTQHKAAQSRTLERSLAYPMIECHWNVFHRVSDFHVCTLRSRWHMHLRLRSHPVPNSGHTTRASPVHTHYWASAQSRPPQKPQARLLASEAHATLGEWSIQALVYARRASR